ncbi:MAG: hypothetical protein A2Z28_04700 [Chloroflexi bacterium RBG_16_51_9]|nr:MAG: hypothetical protein A2Z28_04700 [Chloroflexi bacterium RBG_16_51_9]
MIVAAGISLPHLQERQEDLPQALQRENPSGFSVWHFWHFIETASHRIMPIVYNRKPDKSRKKRLWFFLILVAHPSLPPFCITSKTIPASISLKLFPQKNTRI